MENVNLGSIKRESVVHIFEMVAQKQSVSRADLARMTGLSLMTVGKVADAFLSRGILEQVKENRTLAGRKAGLVSLNREKFAIVLDVTTRHFVMTVIDAAMTVNDKLEYDYNKEFYFEENLYIFLKNVKIYILRRLNMQDCMGIGVSVPGVYDPASDTVSGIRMPELQQIRLKNVVEDILKEKVDVIADDIVAAAVSNTRNLPDCADSTVFYVYIGESVCGSVIRHGEPLFGPGVGYLGQTITGSGRKLEDVMADRKINREQFRDFEIALYNAIWLLNPDVVIVENHKVWGDGDFAERLISDFDELFPQKGQRPPRIVESDADANHKFIGVALKVRSDWRDRTISD